MGRYKDYKWLFENSPSPMVIMNSEGQFLEFNWAYTLMMGYYNKQDFSIENVSADFQVDGLPSTEKVKLMMKSSLTNGHHEFEWLHKDKNEIIFNTKVQLDRMYFQNEICLRAIITRVESDLNDHNNHITDTLRIKNIELESIFQNTLMGLLVTDENRRIIKCNSKLMDIVGYSNKDDLIGKTTVVFYDSTTEFISQGHTFVSELDRSRVFETELSLVKADGTKVLCEISGNPLDNRMPPDLTKGILWVIDDISEKRVLEEELRKQYDLAKDANPLTGIAGNNTILRTIKSSIDHKKDHCIMYLDLDHFKSYNDKYGFLKGDNVLKYTAATLLHHGKNALEDYFVGHIGGDDFVIVCPSIRKEIIAHSIIRHFDRTIPSFYTESAREEGSIESVDRKGFVKRAPMIGISIAGVDLTEVRHLNYLQVIDMCSDLKKEAKLQIGSVVRFNRRTKKS